MDLQIVIVNWNSGEFLGRLLSSLAPLRSEVRQILVVDNGSSDGSAALEGCRANGAELLAAGLNLGFAAAANRAAAASSSEWILLLNPDIEVCPAAVRELYRRSQNIPDLGLASVRLVGPGGTSQAAFQIRPLPSISSVLFDVLFVDEILGLFYNRSRGVETLLATRAESPEAIPVEQPAAAFWLIRRQAWNELGGFDEQFWPAWFEDVDFCRRLAGTRWRAFLFADLQATHAGGVSLKELAYEQFLDTYYSNMIRYLRKHHSSAFPFLKPAVRAGVRLRKLLK